MRVSRSTGRRIPLMTAAGSVRAASKRGRQALGQGPPADRLEAGGGVVRHGGDVLGPRLEADVHGGRVAVGRRGVQRRVELVGGDHPGAALAQLAGDVAGERCRSPPNWPTTTRSCCSEAPTALSCSSSRIAATPGPVPVCERVDLAGRARWRGRRRRRRRGRSCAGSPRGPAPSPGRRCRRRDRSRSRGGRARSAAGRRRHRAGGARRAAAGDRRAATSTRRSASQVGSSHVPWSRRPRWLLERPHGVARRVAERRRARRRPGGYPAAPSRRCRSRMASPC